MEKEPLLYLTHRIPYPPNKGDKLRSYHILRFLAQHYRVYLGTFVDDEADYATVDELGRYCEEAKVVRLRPMLGRATSLRGFLTGEPLTLAYYRSRVLQKWVDGILHEHGISKVVVFCSAMAQYVEARPELRRIVDFVDVDSEKWREYSLERRGPLAQVYRREARGMLDYEIQVSRWASRSFFATLQ